MAFAGIYEVLVTEFTNRGSSGVMLHVWTGTVAIITYYNALYWHSDIWRFSEVFGESLDEPNTMRRAKYQCHISQ